MYTLHVCERCTLDVCERCMLWCVQYIWCM